MGQALQRPGQRFDAASSVAVNLGGTTVFVTGYSAARPGGWDYATFAYGAATGKRLWVSRYNGPANRDDVGSSVTVSPSGTTVYVTGDSIGRAGSGYADGCATVAYGAATGGSCGSAATTAPLTVAATHAVWPCTPSGPRYS